MDQEKLESVKNRIRNLLLKAKADSDIEELLKLGNNSSDAGKLLAEILGGTTATFPSGLTGDLMTDRKGSELALVLDGLFTNGKSKDDPKIVIYIPLSLGEPKIGLFIGNEDNEEELEISGDKVWELVEQMLNHISIEPSISNNL